MKWGDLDFERALWTIPPEASKTGEITGESHLVPLSAGALQIVSRRHARKVAQLSPYVFPTPSGGYMRHPSRGIATIRKPQASRTSGSTTSAGPSRNRSPRSSGKA
jgi:integrase